MRAPIALAAAALVAAAFLFSARPSPSAPPSLAFVAPQPNATLRLARVPISLHLTGSLRPGRYALAVDGRTLDEGPLRSEVRFLPKSPLGTGAHTISAYVFGRGYAWAYRWRVTVLPGAKTSVPRWGKGSEQALSDVNAYRVLAGQRPLRLDIPHEGAARAHSAFFVRNLSRYGTLTLSVHQEQPSWPGYVGRSPYSRDVAFGFNGDGDSEVMAFGAPIGEAVRLWIDSIYHRFGLLDPGLVSMGYGISGSAKANPDLPVTTIDASYQASAEVPNKVAVLWPARGLVGIPLAFEEGEIPDPLANFQGARYPAGYPVTISFFGPSVKGLRVESAILRAGGKAVPAYLLTPQVERHPDELGMSAGLIPKAPLSPHTRYQASFGGSYRDPSGWHPYSYSWSFSTDPVPRLSRRVAVSIGGTPPVQGYRVGSAVYVPLRSILGKSGGSVLWSKENPDVVTAVAGGHRLRLSYLSFSATRDGQRIALRDVPMGPGPNPYVPLREVARLLGIDAAVVTT